MARDADVALADPRGVARRHLVGFELLVGVVTATVTGEISPGIA